MAGIWSKDVTAIKRDGVGTMHILIDPVDMAQKLIEYCHCHDAASYWIIFGRWCQEHQNLPPIYIQAVAGHIMSRADNPGL